MAYMYCEYQEREKLCHCSFYRHAVGNQPFHFVAPNFLELQIKITQCEKIRKIVAIKKNLFAYFLFHPI